MNNMKTSQATIEKLGYYVYLLIDPRVKDKNKGVFYVGKGTGWRAESHLKEYILELDKKEDAKNKRIKEIRNDKKEPEIEILRHGLGEKEAFEIESAMIDFIGKKELTNQVLGHDSADRGRMSLKELEIKYRARKIIVEDSLLLIKINRTFKRGMDWEKIYDITRGNWTIKKEKAEKYKIACAVYRGIVREVFEIKDWQDSPKENIKSKPRIFFNGRVAEEKIRNKYIFRDASEYNCQFPVRYLDAKK
jgi:uncharacterized protein